MMAYGGTRGGSTITLTGFIERLGGFMEEENGSQEAVSSNKSKTGVQSLRPVTIKQLLEAQTAQGDTHIIHSADKSIELGQVYFVGCIRSLRETNTGADYIIEDGTGSIGGKCWQDKAGFPVSVGRWARVHGTLRSMNGARSVNIFSIRAITEHNELTMHFLHVISLNLPQKSSVSVLAGSELLTPLQKAIIGVYSTCRAPQGLHYSSVIRALSDRYSSDDVKDSITWLMSEGYIFETHDSDHAKLVSS